MMKKLNSGIQVSVEEVKKQRNSPEIYARIYIHTESIGKQTECEIAYKNIQGLARKLYKNKQIEGARVFIVEDLYHAKYRLLNIIVDYNEITNHKFPFAYAEIQPEHKMDIKLDENIKELGFERVN